MIVKTIDRQSLERPNALHVEPGRPSGSHTSVATNETTL